MSRKQHRLFIDKDNKPLEFFILNCSDRIKSRLNTVIKLLGGKLIDSVNTTSTIVLIENKLCNNSTKNYEIVCSIQFLFDCIRHKKLLDISNYLIHLPVSNMLNLEVVADSQSKSICNNSSETNTNTKYYSCFSENIGFKEEEKKSSENGCTSDDISLIENSPKNVENEMSMEMKSTQETNENSLINNGYSDVLEAVSPCAKVSSANEDEEDVNSNSPPSSSRVLIEGLSEEDPLADIDTLRDKFDEQVPQLEENPSVNKAHKSIDKFKPDEDNQSQQLFDQVNSTQIGLENATVEIRTVRSDKGNDQMAVTTYFPSFTQIVSNTSDIESQDLIERLSPTIISRNSKYAAESQDILEPVKKKKKTQEDSEISLEIPHSKMDETIPTQINTDNNEELNSDKNNSIGDVNVNNIVSVDNSPEISFSSDDGIRSNEIAEPNRGAESSEIAEPNKEVEPNELAETSEIAEPHREAESNELAESSELADPNKEVESNEIAESREIEESSGESQIENVTTNQTKQSNTKKTKKLKKINKFQEWVMKKLQIKSGFNRVLINSTVSDDDEEEETTNSTGLIQTESSTDQNEQLKSIRKQKLKKRKKLKPIVESSSEEEDITPMKKKNPFYNPKSKLITSTPDVVSSKPSEILSSDSDKSFDDRSLYSRIARSKSCRSPKRKGIDHSEKPTTSASYKSVSDVIIIDDSSDDDNDRGKDDVPHNDRENDADEDNGSRNDDENDNDDDDGIDYALFMGSQDRFADNPFVLRHNKDEDLYKMEMTHLHGRKFEHYEQIAILWYFIKNNGFCHQTKNITYWKKMKRAGYLPHRGEFALLNNFLKQILPNIESFGLTPDLVNLFCGVRAQ